MEKVMKEVFKAKKEMVQIPEGTFNQNKDCRYSPNCEGPYWRGEKIGYMYWCRRHRGWIKDYRLGCDNFSNS